MYSYPEVNRLREGHWDNIGKAIEHFTEKGYVSNLYRNQTTGWVFVHITDEQGLLSQSSDIGKITILLGFSDGCPIFYSVLHLFWKAK